MIIQKNRKNIIAKSKRLIYCCLYSVQVYNIEDFLFFSICIKIQNNNRKLYS